MIYNYLRGDNPIEKHATELEFLNDKIEFEEGLNLIIGPNGTGKTTLVTSIAKLFFAFQQGYPKFNGVTDFSNIFRSTTEVEFSDLVTHNRHPVLFNNKFPESHFDDDNYEESLASFFVKNNHSAGELQTYELNMLASNFEKIQSYRKLANEFKKKKNSYYVDCCDNYMEWLEKGRVADSKKITILLDEPTSNLDIATKTRYWMTLSKLAQQKYQVIVATHDITPFLMCEKYHVIETYKDYFKTNLEPYLEKRSSP